MTSSKMEFRDIDISSKSRVGLCVYTKQDFMNIIKPFSGHMYVVNFGRIKVQENTKKEKTI